jgi:[ribosomal protein S5]-alanine N-acetyltransferase
MLLETARLSLRPCSPAHLLALLERPERFEEVAGLPAAAGLREVFTSNDVSPDWLAALRVSPGHDPWRHGFFVVYRGTGAAIGCAGFKGPPDSTGTVEIAYGIAPTFEGQGYATEAAAALVAYAFATPRVEVVRAHTLPTANASTRVLAKCGFRRVGTVVDPEDGTVWRWERTRKAST